VVGAITISLLTILLGNSELGIHVFGWGIKSPAGTSLVGTAIIMLVVLLLRPSGITGGHEFRLPRPLRGPEAGPEPPAPAPEAGV
jgi:branched-chain amino acid transport system permease protein